MDNCKTAVTHTVYEWCLCGLNYFGVGFRNVGEFGAGLGATVWIRLYERCIT
jgi:hypothetical protein